MDARERPIHTRILRPGDPIPADTNWAERSMDERIEAVWELTKICLLWQGEDEPRLQRTVVRIQRAWR